MASPETIVSKQKKLPWVALAVVSVVLPACGYVILQRSPELIGRPYLWTYFALPVTGAVAMACSFVAVVALVRARAWGWACLSALTLLASVVAAVYGMMVLLFAGLCVGPTYVAPSRILDDSGLAALPLSASHAEGLQSGNIDDRQYFAFFEASPADIAAFINDSAVISHPPYATFDPNNTYAPRRLSQEQLGERWEDDARYTPYLYKVEWFNPNITVKGRLFDFASDQKWGTVLIDDDKNKVYVFLSYGGYRPQKR